MNFHFLINIFLKKHIYICLSTSLLLNTKLKVNKINIHKNLNFLNEEEKYMFSIKTLIVPSSFISYLCFTKI